MNGGWGYNTGVQTYADFPKALASYLPLESIFTAVQAPMRFEDQTNYSSVALWGYDFAGLHSCRADR